MSPNQMLSWRPWPATIIVVAFFAAPVVEAAADATTFAVEDKEN